MMTFLFALVEMLSNCGMQQADSMTEGGGVVLSCHAVSIAQLPIGK
jgi:hypothetical protein